MNLCPEVSRNRQALPHRATPLHPWLQGQAARLSKKSDLGQAAACLLQHWSGLILFAGDGRIEMDSNPVENAIRPLALGRKNALFAGHDEGAQSWPPFASVSRNGLGRCGMVYMERIDPAACMRRFYRVAIERTLFGEMGAGAGMGSHRQHRRPAP